MLGIVKGTEDSLFVLADSDAGGVEIDDVRSVARGRARHAAQRPRDRARRGSAARRSSPSR